MNGEPLSLWDRFKIAITPESHAETVANEMMAGNTPSYYPERATTPQFFIDTERVVSPFKQAAAALDITGLTRIIDVTDEKLSLWDKFTIAITPESRAETLANQMMSPETYGEPGLPGFEETYNTEQETTPQIYIDGKNTVLAPFRSAAKALGSAGAAVSGTLQKYAIIAFVGIALLVVLYVALPKFIRR